MPPHAYQYETLIVDDIDGGGDIDEDQKCKPPFTKQLTESTITVWTKTTEVEGLSALDGPLAGRGTFLADKTLPHYRGSRGSKDQPQLFRTHTC